MDKMNTISDELLARFIEGNVSADEKQEVQLYLEEHPEAFDWLMETEQALSFNKIKETEKQEEQKKSASVYTRSMMDTASLPDDIRYQMPNHGKKMMAAQQPDNNPTCAIMAQQMVLQDYGISVSQDQLLDVAKQNGWYIDSMGTPLDYVGELLNYYKVQAVQFRNANIYHLIHELSQGHRIIVGIDVNALSQDDRWRTFDDVLYGKEANHVLVVGGIDTTDPNHVQVVLSDPTNPEHNKEYSAEQFMKVWEESGYFMVATTTPVPQDHNQLMRNFDYQQGHVQQFADLAFAEIEKRLDEYYHKRDRRRWFPYGIIVLAIAIAVAIYLAVSHFMPINVRVTISEDPQYAIPSMPFESGTLTLEYANIQPITTTLTEQQHSFVLDNISFKNRRKPLHIQLQAAGFVPIDTIVGMNEHISLQIRRNADLATIFGYVRDESGRPVADATLTAQDVHAQSDSIGFFIIHIPPQKQKTTQSVQAFKENYEPWIQHNGAPSATEPYYIVLKKK